MTAILIIYEMNDYVNFGKYHKIKICFNRNFHKQCGENRSIYFKEHTALHTIMPEAKFSWYESLVAIKQSPGFLRPHHKV
jgi:hypothetical protein